MKKTDSGQYIVYNALMNLHNIEEAKIKHQSLLNTLNGNDKLMYINTVKFMLQSIIHVPPPEVPLSEIFKL